MVTTEQIERVRRGVDITTLTGPLRTEGRGLIGRCPTCREVAMQVNRDRGFFLCRACRVCGSAIDYVMAKYRVDFGEAMRRLLALASIDEVER